MQTSRLRSMFKLAYYKELTRAVTTATNASSLNIDQHVKPFEEIPGPSSLPVIGSLHHFLPGGELQDFADINGLKKLFDKYGPIFKLPGVFGVGKLMFICDPETSAHVLRSENWLPIREGFISLSHYRQDYKRSKGHTVNHTGLLTDHGDLWKEFRSAVNPVMLQPRTIQLYTSVLDEVAQDMIKRMKENRDENNRLRNQFDNEMNLWALESIATVALGCRLNSLETTLAEDSPQRDLIRLIHDLFIEGNKLDFRPSLWKYVSTPLYRKVMDMYERHEKLTKYFLQIGIDQLKANAGKKSDHEKGVLEKLLEINEEFAYIMASDMLFAGVDTVSNSITATLYQLAKNPDKQEKLREEILSKSTRRPYLKACNKEAMRIMPIVTGNTRTTTKDYNLLGYKVPAGTNLVFLFREMSLMDKHFPRAHEYIPKRWIAPKDDPIYYGNAHPFVYAPFGFGARSCIGRRIAELEMETFLVRIMENFKVEWDGPPPRIEQTAINYIKGPFHFKFTDL